MTLTVPVVAIGAAIPGRPLFTLAGAGLRLRSRQVFSVDAGVAAGRLGR